MFWHLWSFTQTLLNLSAPSSLRFEAPQFLRSNPRNLFCIDQFPFHSLSLSSPSPCRSLRYSLLRDLSGPLQLVRGRRWLTERLIFRTISSPPKRPMNTGPTKVFLGLWILMCLFFWHCYVGSWFCGPFHIWLLSSYIHSICSVWYL